MPDDLLTTPIESTPDASGDDKSTTPAADPKTTTPAPNAEGDKGKTTPAPIDPKADPKVAPKTEATDDLGLDDADSEDGQPATWPEDWRDRLSGGDNKMLGVLKRYANPENFAKAFRSMQQKLSSGEYKRAALPENATDAEKAEWRKENGIPEKPEEYALPEVKGHEWTDADKPLVNEFLADLHAAGTPQPIAQAALGWYAKFQQRQVEARANLDRTMAEQREDALRKDWGPQDYRAHVNLARQMFADETFMPADLRHALADARLSDGSRLIHNPELMRFLAQQGLERKGTAGLISGEQGARMGSRIDEIRKIMREDNDRYVRENLGAELQELIEKTGSRR